MAHRRSSTALPSRRARSPRRLTAEQVEAYGEFVEEPARPGLERFFFSDDVDRDLIALRRSTHHRFGFALQT